MPNKPSQAPSYLAFSKTGDIRRVSEPLPPEKAALELAIANKFKAALSERFNRDIGPLVPGDRWPDFLTTEGSKRIGIEIVEVVNPEHIAAKGYGVPQFSNVDVSRQLLVTTIRSKIAKNYSVPAGLNLWLLAYDVTAALCLDNAVAAGIAHDHLQTAHHPFSEIWLLCPTPGYKMPSFIESVWPTTEFTSTATR